MPTHVDSYLCIFMERDICMKRICYLSYNTEPIKRKVLYRLMIISTLYTEVVGIARVHHLGETKFTPFRSYNRFLNALVTDLH